MNEWPRPGGVRGPRRRAARRPAHRATVTAGVAKELDIPVWIHVGTGPPGAPYLGFREYRARLHSALTMEDVLLLRHPRRWVYLRHAGDPFLDEFLALMYVHPQVYVDVGAIVFALHRPAFRGTGDAG